MPIKFDHIAKQLGSGSWLEDSRWQLSRAEHKAKNRAIARQRVWEAMDTLDTVKSVSDALKMPERTVYDIIQKMISDGHASYTGDRKTKFGKTKVYKKNVQQTFQNKKENY